MPRSSRSPGRSCDARLPEEPLRPDEKRDREDDERDNGLVHGIDAAREARPRRELLRDTEDEAARERPIRAADTAEYHGREYGKQELKAEVRIERVLDERSENARKAGERSRDEPGDPNGGSDVDARHRSERPVVGHRAKDTTGRRIGKKEGDEDDRHRRGHDGDDLRL